MSRNLAVKTFPLSVARQPGEVGRLRVVKAAQGVGQVYIVPNRRVTLGRGEDADLRFSDLKASRKHAEMVYTQEGWMVQDLGSANGIFFQGQYVRQFKVNHGDVFALGETWFEFFDSTLGNPHFNQPLPNIEEIQKQFDYFKLQKERVRSVAKPVQAVQAQKKKSSSLVLIAALAAAYLYQDDLMQLLGFSSPSQQQQKVKKQEAKSKANEEEKSLKSDLPPSVTPEVEKTSEQYYWQGFREFREGNYLRAKSQFELALQVNPGHERARKYLLATERELETQVRKSMTSGQRAFSIGRLREAKGHYESAMRMLYFDRANPDFIECEDAVKKIDKKLNEIGRDP